MVSISVTPAAAHPLRRLAHPPAHSLTPSPSAAYLNHAEAAKLLLELGANVETPDESGQTAVVAASAYGHAKMLRLLASFKADVTTPVLGKTPLKRAVEEGHFEAAKQLILLGAPVTIEDLKQNSFDIDDTPQLRADLQAWAADALVQHRIFNRTFLFGCSAHEPHWEHDGIALTILEGMEEVRTKVAEFVGVVVGKELRRTRATGPAIAAVDWAAHDQPWPPSDDDE